MKLLLVLLRKSPGLVVLAILAGVVSGASNAGLLALINTAIYTHQPWRDSRLVWSFVGLCLLLPTARAFSAYVLSVLGQNAVLELRTQLCRKILLAPLRKLEEIGSHRLLVALTQDVTTIVMALSALPLLFVQGAIVTGSLIYLGWLSGKVLVALLVFLTIGVVTYQVPMLRATAYQRRAREQADTLYAHFRAITGGVKELKLHSPRQNALIRDLDATGGVLKRFTVISSTIFSLASGWGQLLVFCMIGGVIFIVPAYAQVPMKTMTGYALILLYMMAPMETILDIIPNIARAKVSFQKVEELGISLERDLPPAARVIPAVPPQRGGWSSLELAGVTHAYHREREESSFTLGPIDFTLWPGEIVFLVGGNGSGKTTLAKLILGLYAPESGEVRFDERPVTDENRVEYMQRFSVVFSDFYLFDSLLGMESPDTDDQAARYLRQLHLDHKVRVEKGQLSTTELSQGQRKRLALLTAYLEDRAIYLFDEWAADQDPIFKEVFYLQLLPELKARGKTVIVISHDDHYYSMADRIIKLDYGRVEYDGSPDGFQYRPVEARLASAPEA
ncbi:MAG: cyclic peptide export ABC transporter [Gemmatimonadetes bacterium]|nr:cyclic peptide export ABC transporter [Gemmatimonadota bacterium]